MRGNGSFLTLVLFVGQRRDLDTRSELKKLSTHACLLIQGRCKNNASLNRTMEAFLQNIEARLIFEIKLTGNVWQLRDVVYTPTIFVVVKTMSQMKILFQRNLYSFSYYRKYLRNRIKMEFLTKSRCSQLARSSLLYKFLNTAFESTFQSLAYRETYKHVSSNR